MPETTYERKFEVSGPKSHHYQRKLYDFALEMGVNLTFDAIFEEGLIFKRQFIHATARSTDLAKVNRYVDSVQQCIEEYSSRRTGVSGYGV
jgi:hypothetical protein